MFFWAYERTITIGNFSKTIPEWTEYFGYTRYLIGNRLCYGWPDNLAVLEPLSVIKSWKSIKNESTITKK